MFWTWAWLAGKTASGLIIWAAIENLEKRALFGKKIIGQFSYIAIAVSAFFWGTASLIFIDMSRAEVSLLAIAMIITLTAVESLTCTLATMPRRIFLIAAYLPLIIAIWTEFPDRGAGFLILLVALSSGIDLAARRHRSMYVQNTANNLRAEHNKQQMVSTSKKMTSLIEHTPLGFIEWNKNREIINWNPAARNIFGYDEEEVMGRNASFLFQENKDFLIQQVENDLFMFGKDFSGTTENLTRDGKVITCEWNYTPLLDESRNVVGAASFIEDITDRVRHESRIKQQAYFDPLTGLPNRHRLMEELNRVISFAQRNEQYCSLLFIDLDHFKHINDSRGHHYGDLTLSLFAQRLRKVIRTEETVARLGGDEFVVLLENLGKDENSARLQIVQVAEKIIDAAKETFIIKGEKFQIGCSIGIVVFNNGAADGNTILQQADQALYTIKRGEKSNFYFHDRRLTSEAQQQIDLLETLRSESSANAFLPYYQPILDSDSNLIHGLQVYLRWQKAADEIITASEIIKVLESGSMIVDVSLALIDQVCRQVSIWKRQGLWRESQKIYFNLSLRELEHPSFIAQFEETLAIYGLTPSTFTFNMHAVNLSKLTQPLELQLSQLRELGTGFTVDNIGYQSLPLQKLRQLEIDKIRVSSKLIEETKEIESSKNLVKGLIELAKSVHVECIAPCVEDIDIHHLLIEQGCRLLQGNLIAPPSPQDAITRMLIERSAANDQGVSAQ